MELEGWTPGPGKGDVVSTHYFDIGTGLQPQNRSYLLGIVLARLGRADEALRHARKLESEPPSDPAFEAATDMARTVRAEVHLARGDTAAALADLERVRMQIWYNLMNQSPFYSQAYARYRRADLLEATGRLGEALRWYGSFDEGSLYDFAWHPTALLRSAALHERLDERERAAATYDRVLDFWSGSDPELADLVEDAGEGARRAGGGSDPS